MSFIAFSLMDIDAGMEIAPPGYWKAKGGSLIRIADMTDQHLVNALLCWAKNIERLGGSYEKLTKNPKWKELKAEIDRRGMINQVFPVGDEPQPRRSQKPMKPRGRFENLELDDEPKDK